MSVGHAGNKGSRLDKETYGGGGEHSKQEKPGTIQREWLLVCLGNYFHIRSWGQYAQILNFSREASTQGFRVKSSNFKMLSTNSSIVKHYWQENIIMRPSWVIGYLIVILLYKFLLEFHFNSGFQLQGASESYTTYRILRGVWLVWVGNYFDANVNVRLEIIFCLWEICPLAPDSERFPQV